MNEYDDYEEISLIFNKQKYKKDGDTYYYPENSTPLINGIEIKSLNDLEFKTNSTPYFLVEEFFVGESVLTFNLWSTEKCISHKDYLDIGGIKIQNKNIINIGFKFNVNNLHFEIILIVKTKFKYIYED